MGKGSCRALSFAEEFSIFLLPPRDLGHWGNGSSELSNSFLSNCLLELLHPCSSGNRVPPSFLLKSFPSLLVVSQIETCSTFFHSCGVQPWNQNPFRGIARDSEKRGIFFQACGHQGLCNPIPAEGHFVEKACPWIGQTSKKTNLKDTFLKLQDKSGKRALLLQSTTQLTKLSIGKSLSLPACWKRVLSGLVGGRGRFLETKLIWDTGTQKKDIFGCLDGCWRVRELWKHDISGNWLISPFSFLSFPPFLQFMMSVMIVLFITLWQIFSKSLKSELFIFATTQCWHLWLSSLASLGFFWTRCYKLEKRSLLKIKLFIHKTVTLFVVGSKADFKCLWVNCWKKKTTKQSSMFFLILSELL